MKPFERGELPSEFQSPQAYMNSFKVDYLEASKMVRLAQLGELYINDVYQVQKRGPFTPPGTWPTDSGLTQWPQMFHLSIKRRDKEPIRDWRDLQTIKNMLVGPEHEAMEIYPAESRLVDMANQYHLWVFADPAVRIPTGWTERMVFDEVHAEKRGAKQRPFRSLEDWQRSEQDKMVGQLPKEKGFIAPEGGWKANTYYVVDVAFNSGNPIHRSILYVGFLPESNGNPLSGNYTQLMNGTYEVGDGAVGESHPSMAYYLRAVKEIPEMSVAPY